MIKQEPGKRIVSKDEYARIRIKLLSLKIGTFLIALLCVIVYCTIFINIFFVHNIGVHKMLPSTLLSLSLLASLLLFYIRVQAVQAKCREFKSVVPLTRANTGDFPAADSLVRASEQPSKAQQTIQKSK